MTEYLTEQEQIQQLKLLARRYIPSVLVGLLLAFAGSTGWQMFKKHQNNIRIQASMLYEDMLAAKTASHHDEMIKAAKTLTEQYPRTVYAAQGAFMLAEDAVSRNDLVGAEDALNTVLKKGRKTGLYSIALIRLARINLARGEPQKALDLLDNHIDPAFVGLTDMVRGDALSAQHDVAGAAKAYRLALQTLPNTGISTLLQMKIDNLSTGIST